MAEHHILPVRLYLGIFAVLLLFTALTIWAAFQNFGPMNDVIALGIAVIKASLVVLYFMHVRYQSRLVSVAVVTGIAWLGVLVMLVLMDYMSRGWLPFPGK